MQTIDLKVDGVKKTATFIDPIKVRKENLEYVLHESTIRVTIVKDRFGNYFAINCL